MTTNSNRNASRIQSFLSVLLTFGCLSAVSLGAIGCTTTSEVPEAQQNVLPDEYTKEENTHTYGVIEDDLEAYQWTGGRYDDPRFAEELDNSPQKVEPTYEPQFSRSQIKPKPRKMKVVKASSRSKARKTTSSKKSKSKQIRR